MNTMLATLVFAWRDLLEIALLFITFSSLLSWLARDTTKPLASLCILYSCFGLCTWALQLSTLFVLMLWATPMLCFFFYIVHQETLQKNFIALYKVPFKTAPKSLDWIEELFGIFLYALNQKKELIVVIQGTDALASFLHPGVQIHAPLQASHMHLLLESTIFNQEKMIWLQHTGSVLGINTSVATHLTLHTPNVRMPEWQQNALLITAKTDAIVIKSCARTRMFSLISNGSLVEAVATQEALKLLRTYCAQFHVTKGNNHVTPTQQTSRQHL